MALVECIERYKNRGYHGFFEDWNDNYVTGDRWTPLTADSSSASTLVLVLKNTGSTGGILSITQDATDNDEIYFGQTVTPFLIAAGKNCIFETRLQFTEGNTSGQNICAGFLSTASGSLANTMIDDGGGPVATATMAMIYKIDGGTVWRCRSQIGAAVGQTDTVTNITAGQTAYQTLRIEINPISSTNADVIYSLDNGNGMKQMTDSNGKVFKHNLLYTNALTMGALFGQKTGSGTAEVLLNDYVTAWQVR